MLSASRLKLYFVVTLGAYMAAGHSASMAQFNRYEPSRPTVSPYLQLYNTRNTNSVLPNYYSFVRPLQQQYQTNQNQQQQIQDQSRTIQQLQSNLQVLQQQQQMGPVVAPTGHGSWFNVQAARSQFLNTSRYYSRSGVTPR